MRQGEMGMGKHIHRKVATFWPPSLCVSPSCFKKKKRKRKKERKNIRAGIPGIQPFVGVEPVKIYIYIYIHIYIYIFFFF